MFLLVDCGEFLTFLKSGPGAVNLGKKHLDHQSLENLMQSKRTGPQLKTMDIRSELLQLHFIKLQENLYKNVNENMFSFTFLCKLSCICNFAIFVRICMKFSPKCRTNKFVMITPFWDVFAHFLIGKGPTFGLGPKSGLGKSLDC